MREHLYRAKRKDNGEWVTGYLVKTTDGGYLITPYVIDCDDEKLVSDIYAVIPQTVGEFTGLYDKKGTLIFEGNILRITTPKGVMFYKVVYEDCSFVGVDQNDVMDEIVHWNDVEVIGNIHDNPELLEASHD